MRSVPVQVTVKVFKKRPRRLFLVLTNGMHTNEYEKPAHGHAGQGVVQKNASPATRMFVLQQHQAGVPPARILQSVNPNKLWCLALFTCHFPVVVSCFVYVSISNNT
jgi:hypothetical protein